MSEITPAQVGANIKRIRKQSNLKQAELAKLADLHTTQIAHYECGLRMPTIQNLVKIAEALRCGIAYLINGEGYDPGLDLRGIDFESQGLLRQLASKLRNTSKDKKLQDMFVNPIDQWNHENKY